MIGKVLVLWPVAFVFGVGMIASAVVLSLVAKGVEKLGKQGSEGAHV